MYLGLYDLGLIKEPADLAYFTHKITLPFLYFVEVSSQAQLVQIFPQLFNDLNEGRMDTLKDCVINYPHIKDQKLAADIEEKILQKMCIDATKVLGRQAGRECSFGSYKGKPTCASQLHLLSKDDLAVLPTNNVDAEHFSVFGRKNPVAGFGNKKFIAKGV